jgi:hypothetical protein
MIDNHERAKKDFKQAIELKKTYAIAHFCLGKSRLELYKQNKSQLGGIIGKQAIQKAMDDFYNAMKFDIEDLSEVSDGIG